MLHPFLREEGDLNLFNVSEVTKCSATVNGESISVFDTPGLNDSRLRLSNRQIKAKLEYEMCANLATSIDAILIFDSLHG